MALKQLGLIDVSLPFKDRRGVYRMDGRDFQVIDLDTGAPLENQVAMCWGSGSMLCDGEEPLLTPEHVSRDKDYLVVVVECGAAIRLERGKTYRPEMADGVEDQPRELAAENADDIKVIVSNPSLPD